MALLKWFDKNIEKLVIFICYSSMAGIVFVEVIRRFVFSQQAAWSTTIPIYLFLWITWIGASYNVKIEVILSLMRFGSGCLIIFNFYFRFLMLFFGLCSELS